MTMLLISIASLLFIIILIISFLLAAKSRSIAMLRQELQANTEKAIEQERKFKEQENNLLTQLKTINSSIDNIESECSEIMNQNNKLTQELKQKNIDLKVLEHKMSKLSKESNGYNVAMFIEWLNNNGINTEQAKIMMTNAIELEQQLKTVKTMYDKLDSEKRLLENYADSISKQLQIALKSN